MREFQGDVRVVPLTRAEWDVTLPAPAGLPEVDVVVHAAAWTDVDGAEDSARRPGDLVERLTS